MSHGAHHIPHGACEIHRLFARRDPAGIHSPLLSVEPATGHGSIFSSRSGRVGFLPSTWRSTSKCIRWTPIWKPQIKKLTELLGRPRGTFSKAQLMAAYDRFYDRGVNCAKMRTMGSILERLVAGKLISSKASHKMLSIMKGAKTSTHRILGRLPRGTIVAHKTGSQFKRVCDVGAIYLSDGKPIVVAACTESTDVKRAEATIAQLSRKAYDLVGAHRRKRAGR